MSTTLICFFCAMPLPAVAEIVCAFGPAASSYNSYQDQRPSPDAMELAVQVNAALAPMCRPRCPVIAVFRNETAPNAILVASPTGDAKIVYAPRFFTSIYDSAGDGAILAVIAHELGHALDETAPSAWTKATWTAEQRADAWAGCALARTNPNARALRDTLTALAKYPVAADPGWNARLQALRTGYIQCGGDGNRFNNAAAGEHK